MSKALFRLKRQGKTLIYIVLALLFFISTASMVSAAWTYVNDTAAAATFSNSETTSVTKGLRFVPNQDIQLINVSKFTTDTTKRARICTSIACGTLIDTAFYSGNVATFLLNVTLTKGTTYYVITDGNGSSYTSKYETGESYPQAKTNVNFTGSVYAAADHASEQGGGVIGFVSRNGSNEETVGSASFVDPTPVDSTANNTQVQINVNCSGNNVYLYFDNNTAPTTLVLTNSSTTFYNTNVTVEQRYYYKAHCYNATSLLSGTNTSVRSWVYDLTEPSIVLESTNGWNMFNASNENQYDDNLSIKITFNDNIGIFGIAINITKDGTTYFNVTLLNLSGTTYTYNNTLNTASWPAGDYLINVSASDDHTQKNIPDYGITKKGNGLDFVVEKGNRISITSESMKEVEAKKEKDRYTFEFNFTNTEKKDRVFDVVTDKCPLYYVENSGFAGHFVSSCGVVGNWIDFEGASQNPTVKRINDYHYTVSFKNLDKSVKFHSVGGLNVNTRTYLWYRGNKTFNNNTGLQGETSTLQMNATMGGRITDISAALYYNNTLVTITSNTATSSYEDFIYTFLAPLVSATFNFTWVVNVTQSNGGLNYTFNLSSGQIVNPFLVDNCSTSSNKTLTFTMYNESNPSTKINGTFEIDVLFWATSKNNSRNFTYYVSNAQNASVCISPANVTLYSEFYVRYTAVGGFTHRWYLYNHTLTGTEQNISVYNFDTTAGTSDMRLTTRNKTTYNYMLNVVTSLQRFYVAENIWRTVQMDKSGDFGLLFFNIIEESVDYRLLFKDTNNNILDTTESMKFSCTSGVCDLTKLLSDATTTAASEDVTGSITYNNVTGNISFVWTNPSGTSTTVNFAVNKLTGTGSVNVCNASQTAAGGTFSCSMAAYTGEVFVSVDQDNERIIGEHIDVGGQKLGSLLTDKEKAFWAFVIVLVVAVFGLFSPVGAVLAAFVGTLFVFLLGIMPSITLPFMIVLGAITVVIGLRLKT